MLFSIHNKSGPSRLNGVVSDKKKAWEGVKRDTLVKDDSRIRYRLSHRNTPLL